MVKVNDNESISFDSVQFIDDSTLHAHYYPEIKMLHFIWKNRCTSEEYRRHFNTALEFAARNNACFFLSDTRLQGIISPEDRKWFEQLAIPGAIERGLVKAAIIKDGNAFKMYYLNLLLKTFVKLGIPVKLFGETQPALDWFLENQA